MPLKGGGLGPRQADLHLLEAVLHGWGLTTATGQDRADDPDTVEAVFQSWCGNYPDFVLPHTGMGGRSKTGLPHDRVTSELACPMG
ncbi:hypothetical protein J7F03_38065 [Streptomyces sp. ISL-43]|uniref:hypothetical protein n=1 Tax=Streptomyces sp. ISL-43 TaxID=2819183 RepID=UPI001BEAFA4C|nr:hypothetical protein [Streptomyces sp. ISL-43]MBT2452746.1 hypothetical protein [Streptomyces sp. ISL-43]